MTVKSLKLYQEQVELLKQEQRRIVEDIVQVLTEAVQDGYSFDDVINTPRPTPSQPGFDL